MSLHFARAAQIGVYSAFDDESDKCGMETFKVITAFLNVCTASSFGGGVKLISCTDSLINGSIWTRNKTICSDPTDNQDPTDYQAIINATKNCSFWVRIVHGSHGIPGYAWYTKILDATCVAPSPSNVLISALVIRIVGTVVGVLVLLFTGYGIGYCRYRQKCCFKPKYDSITV